MPSAHLRVLLAALLTATLALNACGSGDAADSTTAEAESSSYSALLETAYTGVASSPPTEPTQAQPGLNVWYLSCGEQVPVCANGSSQFTETAAVLDWTVNTCDGQLSPTGWANCVRQAIAADADVLVVGGVSCSAIQQPLVEARDAGLVTVAVGGLDCDQAGGEKAFSAVLKYEDDPLSQYATAGRLQADYVIGKTDGNAKVLLLNFTDEAWGAVITDAVREELAAKCDTCEIVSTLDLGNADVGGGSLVQKFSTALLEASDANVVISPVDLWFGLGIAQAIGSTGRDIVAIGNAGDVTNLDLIRSGSGQTATVASDSELVNWASVDLVLRAVNGDPTVAEGTGTRVIDADHNMPASGPYVDPVDYQAAYKKAWGLPE